jgi:hypothetical protein
LPGEHEAEVDLAPADADAATSGDGDGAITALWFIITSALPIARTSKIQGYMGLKFDQGGQKRDLYSMRHTCIMNALLAGILIASIAKNAGASVDVIERFYGSHPDQ